MIEELTKELILTAYPHLRGAIRVEMTRADILYAVRRGSAGIVVEIGSSAIRHKRRSEIIARAGNAAQDVHTGLTTAFCVTAADEAHL